MRTQKVKYPSIQEIDTGDWCSRLQCSSDELQFCIERVGTSWICVEAFWSMNQDRIRASINRSVIFARS